MERNLTEKQKLFIDYYIETGSQSEAARMAGYKQPYVQGKQNYEKLRKFIDERLQAKDNERIASQDEVLRFLTAVMRNEMTEEVVVIESKGKFISEAKKTDKGMSARDRIKAAELLDKRYGGIVIKTEIQPDPLSASLAKLAGEIDDGSV